MPLLDLFETHWVDFRCFVSCIEPSRLHLNTQSTAIITTCKLSSIMPRSRNNDEQVQIGARLRAARLALGLSQKDLYEAIGVKASAWNHWESGKRMPDPMAMAELYRLHGVTMEWIYAGDPKGLPFGVAQTILKAAS